MSDSPAPTRRSAGAARPSHGRAHNLSLLLRTLHAQGAMSRADLSRELGLTKVTVSDLVAELLQRGHAIEVGTAELRRPGKPATLVDLNRTGLQIIGIDLADADELRAAVLDLDGNILTRVSTAITEESGDAVTDLVIDLTERAIEAATAPLLGIGVGTPGIVSSTGTVLTAPNLDWTNLPLREILEQRTGLAVLVGNDADAAALAHYTFGGGSEQMMLVKIGRGVGAGLVVDGRRVQGTRSAAGEIGHVTVGTDGGELCACGRHGCLETWLSSAHLHRAFAASPTEADRERVIGVAGERLAIALAPVIAALDLAELAISAPAELRCDALLNAVSQTLDARIFRAHEQPALLVRFSDPSADIVLRGTAVLVLSAQLGVT